MAFFLQKSVSATATIVKVFAGKITLSRCHKQNSRLEQLLYSELKHSNWMLQVTLLVLTDKSTPFYFELLFHIFFKKSRIFLSGL